MDNRETRKYLKDLRKVKDSIDSFAEKYEYAKLNPTFQTAQFYLNNYYITAAEAEIDRLREYHKPVETE